MAGGVQDDSDQEEGVSTCKVGHLWSKISIGVGGGKRQVGQHTCSILHLRWGWVMKEASNHRVVKNSHL